MNKKQLIGNRGCRLLAALFAGLLILAGCESPLESPRTEKPAQSGMGRFSLSIGGIKTGRTILPPMAVKDDAAKYVLVFSAYGKSDVTAERTNENLSESVELPIWVWRLEVTAYLDAEKTKPVARGTKEGIEITGGVP